MAEEVPNPEDNSSENYSTIREFLGHFIGVRLVEITQHDQEEWEESKESYVTFMFESGDYIKVWIGDLGFDYTKGGASPDGL